MGTTQEAGAAGRPTGIERVAIRPAGRSDADRLRRFLASLSERTTYSRFFTGLGPISARMLGWLLGQDGGRQTLLAVHGDEIVGHGMYAPVPGREDVAELALVVADAWQRQGLGTRLAGALLTAARCRGIRQIEFSVLADNQPANRLAARSWPQAHPVIDHGVYEYLVPVLADAEADAA